MSHTVLMTLAIMATHSAALPFVETVENTQEQVRPSSEVTTESPLADEATREEVVPANADQPPVEDAIEAPVELASPIIAEAVAFADIDDAALYEKAADALESITTMKARFTQYSPSGNVYEGDFYLRRPGQFRMDYEDEDQPLLMATNGRFYSHEDWNEDGTQSIPVRETPLRYILTGRLNRDAADLVRIIREPDRVGLVLQPKDDQLDGQLVLVFTAPDMQFIGWSVLDAYGSMTQVGLSEIETGIRLNNRLFVAPQAERSFTRDR